MILYIICEKTDSPWFLATCSIDRFDNTKPEYKRNIAKPIKIIPINVYAFIHTFRKIFSIVT